MTKAAYKAHYQLIERGHYTIVNAGNCGHRHKTIFAAMKCEDKYKTLHSKINDGLIQNTWCEKHA